MKPREFVATIAIITHGRSTEFDISPEIASMFDNTRMYALSSRTGSVNAGSVICTNTHGHLNEIFRRNLHDENTLDVMKNYATHSAPKYAGFYSDMNDRGNIYDPITFDKMFNLVEADGYMGIFLVSIHEKVSAENTDLQLVYPLPEHANQNIDLTNLNDITALGEYLGSDNLSDIIHDVSHGASPEFPKRNINMLSRVLGTGETAGVMSNRFTDNREYSRYVENGRILLMRMSYLVTLLKQLLGDNTHINILDYSCSDPRIGMGSREIEEYVKYKTPGDIETGMKQTFGGNVRGKKNIYRRSIRTKRTKRTKRAKRTKRTKRSIRTKRTKRTKRANTQNMQTS